MDSPLEERSTGKMRLRSSMWHGIQRQHVADRQKRATVEALSDILVSRQATCVASPQGAAHRQQATGATQKPCFLPCDPHTEPIGEVGMTLVTKSLASSRSHMTVENYNKKLTT